MNKKNRWEELFDELLDLIEFRLIKYPDGWGLLDRQGANMICNHPSEVNLDNCYFDREK